MTPKTRWLVHLCTTSLPTSANHFLASSSQVRNSPVGGRVSVAPATSPGFQRAGRVIGPSSAQPRPVWCPSCSSSGARRWSSGKPFPRLRPASPSRGRSEIRGKAWQVTGSKTAVGAWAPSAGYWRQLGTNCLISLRHRPDCSRSRRKVQRLSSVAWPKRDQRRCCNSERKDLNWRMMCVKLIDTPLTISFGLVFWKMETIWYNFKWAGGKAQIWVFWIWTDLWKTGFQQRKKMLKKWNSIDLANFSRPPLQTSVILSMTSHICGQIYANIRFVNHLSLSCEI